MITETMERPLTSRQLAEGEAWEQRKQEAYDRAASDVMAGRGDFWNQIERPYDADQEMTIFAAVMLAVGSAATGTLGDDEFKKVVMDAVWYEAKRYAAEKAEETL